MDANVAPTRLEPVEGYMFIRLDIVDKADNHLLFREIIRAPEDTGWLVNYTANPVMTNAGPSKTYAIVMTRVL